MSLGVQCLASNDVVRRPTKFDEHSYTLGLESFTFFYRLQAGKPIAGVKTAFLAPISALKRQIGRTNRREKNNYERSVNLMEFTNLACILS